MVHLARDHFEDIRDLVGDAVLWVCYYLLGVQ